MADSDCIVIMGSNMAESHPVAFRWPMKAKVEHGAKIIHVDPRFTRTSAVADIHVPIRAGSDLIFLGGLVNHVLNSENWSTDPFFKTWLVHYSNAATIISGEYKDTEDNDGVFSGLMEYKGGVEDWPYNGFVGEYDSRSWQYARTRMGDQGRVAATAQSGEVTTTRSGTQADTAKAPDGPPYDALVKSLLTQRGVLARAASGNQQPPIAKNQSGRDLNGRMLCTRRGAPCLAPAQRTVIHTPSLVIPAGETEAIESDSLTARCSYK